MHQQDVEITGHLMDSGILSQVLSDIRGYDGDYVITRIDVGHDAEDESHAVISVSAEDEESMQRLLMRLQTRGVNQVDPGQASVSAVEQDGVFPDGFYSTTNLVTRVRLDGKWVMVDNPEMDCGLVVDDAGDVPAVLHAADGRREGRHAGGVRRRRDQGRATASTRRSAGRSASWSPTCPARSRRRCWCARSPTACARRRRPARRCSGSAARASSTPAPRRPWSRWSGPGYVDVLFAGNALATHDIESALYGTSLGVDLALGRGVEHGHEHHIRALNTIRKCGSIQAAVDQGVLTGGVMHALVTEGKKFVLVGSVRDDGPLPDVYTDVIDGQRAMRAELPGVGFCLMVATMLHSVATGNILPASIPLVCVDINPATVTKLADRGSSQARGIVTDVGLFLEQLAIELVPSYRRP